MKASSQQRENFFFFLKGTSEQNNTITERKTFSNGMGDHKGESRRHEGWSREMTQCETRKTEDGRKRPEQWGFVG